MCRRTATALGSGRTERLAEKRRYRDVTVEGSAIESNRRENLVAAPGSER